MQHFSTSVKNWLIETACQIAKLSNFVTGAVSARADYALRQVVALRKCLILLVFRHSRSTVSASVSDFAHIETLMQIAYCVSVSDWWI